MSTVRPAFSDAGRNGATDPASLRVVVASSVAILCLAAILLECVTDMLPDGPLFWLITPVRLVLAVGLIAVLAIRMVIG